MLWRSSSASYSCVMHPLEKTDLLADGILGESHLDHYCCDSVVNNNQILRSFGLYLHTSHAKCGHNIRVNRLSGPMAS